MIHTWDMGRGQGDGGNPSSGILSGASTYAWHQYICGQAVYVLFWSLVCWDRRAFCLRQSLEPCEFSIARHNAYCRGLNAQEGKYVLQCAAYHYFSSLSPFFPSAVYFQFPPSFALGSFLHQVVKQLAKYFYHWVKLNEISFWGGEKRGTQVTAVSVKWAAELKWVEQIAQKLLALRASVQGVQPEARRNCKVKKQLQELGSLQYRTS